MEQGWRLPRDPLMHFAEMVPEATQAVLAAAAAASGGGGGGGAAGQAPQQQQQGRAARPVSLLGEATAPVLGSQELEAAPDSTGAKHAGEYSGGIQRVRIRSYSALALLWMHH